MTMKMRKLFHTKSNCTCKSSTPLINLPSKINKEYLSNKIKEKQMLIVEKLKETALELKSKEFSPENIKSIYKEIFKKMRESLADLKTKMIESIQQRVEENISAVRAEYSHIMKLCTVFEKEYLQGYDLSLIDHHERREKVEIPKAFKLQDLVDKK